MENRNMNVPWLIEVATRWEAECLETNFIAIRSDGDIQVTEEGLLELAGVADWKWRNRKCGVYPHEAYVMVGDMRFFTILSDGEKRGMLAGELEVVSVTS